MQNFVDQPRAPDNFLSCEAQLYTLLAVAAGAFWQQTLLLLRLQKGEGDEESEHNHNKIES